MQSAIFDQHALQSNIVDRLEFEHNQSLAHKNATGENIVHGSRGLLSDSILRIEAFRRGPRWESQLDSLMNSDQLQLNEKMDDAFVADFEFSCTPSSMRFNESLREIYGISEYNISLPEDCLGGWFPGWRSVMKLAFKEVSCGFAQ